MNKMEIDLNDCLHFFKGIMSGPWDYLADNQPIFAVRKYEGCFETPEIFKESLKNSILPMYTKYGDLYLYKCEWVENGVIDPYDGKSVSVGYLFVHIRDKT